MWRSIEVLKGSQSTLYGGDAVAGVINVVTTKGAVNGLRHDYTVEGGEFGTIQGSYTLSGGNRRGNFAITGAGYRSDGFSAAEEDNGNTEEDGFRHASLSARGEYSILDNVKAFCVFPLWH
jgi:vitamin B12 transporter